MFVLKFFIKIFLRKVKKYDLVWLMMGGSVLSQVLIIAKKLNLSELLKSPLTLDEISQLTSTDPAILKRFLDCMVCCGIISQESDGRFVKTEMTDYLWLSTDVFYGNTALFAWMNGWEKALKTGTPAWDHAYGETFYQTLNKTPDFSLEFDQWNTETAKIWLKPLIAQYNFKKFKRAVDLGGGQGVLLNMVLETNSHLSGILFDRKEVVKKPLHSICDYVAKGRCQIIDGNLLTDKFPIADLYCISRVLLNMSDEQVLKVLTQCKNSMSQNSRLIIIDLILPEKNNLLQPLNLLNDLNLFMLMGGINRSKKQWMNIIQKASLQVSSIVSGGVTSHFSILEVENAV